MRLYMHPVSMTSRPVRLFIKENAIPVEEQVVDLMTGEHYKEPFVRGTCRQVRARGRRFPAHRELGDPQVPRGQGELARPKDLKQRARVNEVMDWLNTQFYREYGYHFVYPQIFPNHRRPTDEAQKATVEWGKKHGQEWLRILNDHWIGKNQYLAATR